MLKKELIQLQVQASDRNDAIRKSFAPFLQHGYITNDYIEECIQSLETYGPYIAIAPRIALPHSDLTSAVLHPGIGITVLKEPVCFNSFNDPIKYLFPMCANFASGHMESLVVLSELFSDKHLFELLDQAESTKELFDAMKLKNL